MIHYLGAVIKRIESTKPGVNPPLPQMRREIIEDAAEEDGVIGRQLWLPDEIRGGSTAEGAIERSELANLGRVHVGHDLSHAALGQLAQTALRRRFRRLRRKSQTHQSTVKRRRRRMEVMVPSGLVLGCCWFSHGDVSELVL